MSPNSMFRHYTAYLLQHQQLQMLLWCLQKESIHYFTRLQALLYYIFPRFMGLLGTHKAEALIN